MLGSGNFSVSNISAPIPTLTVGKTLATKIVTEEETVDFIHRPMGDFGTVRQFGAYAPSNINALPFFETLYFNSVPNKPQALSAEDPNLLTLPPCSIIEVWIYDNGVPVNALMNEVFNLGTLPARIPITSPSVSVPLLPIGSFPFGAATFPPPVLGAGTINANLWTNNIVGLAPVSSLERTATSGPGTRYGNAVTLGFGGNLGLPALASASYFPMPLGSVPAGTNCFGRTVADSGARSTIASYPPGAAQVLSGLPFYLTFTSRNITLGSVGDLFMLVTAIVPPS